MNKKEKKAFVRALCATVQYEVIQAISDERIPDNWDGIELRQLIAEKFAAKMEDSGPYALLKGPRRKAYKNTVLTQNL